jgi:hypothetical protein
MMIMPRATMVSPTESSLLRVEKAGSLLKDVVVVGLVVLTEAVDVEILAMENPEKANEPVALMNVAVELDVGVS